MSPERIYLDHAAGGVLLPSVQKEMLRYLVGIQASPGGGHREGREAREEVEKARQRVADFLGAKEAEGVVFTSGGTEAVQSAIHGWGGSVGYRDWETDRKSTRLNSSHSRASRMPSSA